MAAPAITTGERIDQLRENLREIENQLSSPDTANDQERMTRLGKDHQRIKITLEMAERLAEAERRRDEAKEILATEKDPEMRELAELDLAEAEEQIPELSEDLHLRLLPPDPLDERNLILEIRAGTGGDEAAIFAGDLLRMYSRYAETMDWSLEMMSETESESGGFKEVALSVKGSGAYSFLKYEAGGHRVQRIPVTESQGRIHTSAATVAVLPEAEESDVEILDSDLRIDKFRASGAGGQHVNKTESAIRITHIPSGVVVSCQDERSQHKNKAKAMTVLRSRLLEEQIRRDAQARSDTRKAMVGSGDRSERIRTYNFPQNRITDHRINLTLYNLDKVMEGELDPLLKALRKAEMEQRMDELG